jgi:hypothetical protein
MGLVKTETATDAIAQVGEEAEKKFDDAIYRMRTGETKTADQLWDELRTAQESDCNGTVAGLNCTSILNQLARRGQISKNW